MKKLLSISLFLFFALTAIAQPYGNEWIDHNQKYLRINITAEGICRIDSTALASALGSIGTQLSTIDARSLQVYARGQEQYIYVKGEADGAIDNGDYIEFYAKRNDGYLDTFLYEGGAAFQPNPYFSIFNDTAAYYLTWNNLVSNRRLAIENDINFPAYSPDNFFLKDNVYIVSGDYYYGQTNGIGARSPRYTKAEGWFQWPRTEHGNTSPSWTVSTSNAFTGAGAPQASVSVVMAGDSENGSNFPNPDHHIQVEYNGSSGWTTVSDTFFRGYELVRFSYLFNPAQLGSSGTDFRYTSVFENAFSQAGNGTIMSHIRVKYPHTLSVENNSSYRFIVPHNASQAKSFFDLSDLSSSSSAAFVYDLTNNKRIDVVQSGNSFRFLIPNSPSGAEKQCYISCDAGAISLSASSFIPVNGTGQFVDYFAMNTDSAFVIVTHKSLMAEALQYKAWRGTNAGGSHSVIIAEVQDLYDQFAHGVNKNPLAIRRFCEFMLDTFSSAPQDLFLIGKSLPSSVYKYYIPGLDKVLVPTFGSPGADILFTAGLNGSDPLLPAIPTGRLSAKSPSDVALYLDKVMEYESAPADEWQKKILHFAGGSTANERLSFQQYLKMYEDTLEAPYFGGDVITFKKTSNAPIQINQSDSLKELIDNGVSIMTFFGHASGTGFDQSIDHPQNYDPLPGRYPLLVANSCYAGDIHTESPSSSEEFVLIANKGVIGYIASVSLGVPYALYNYTSKLFSNISKRSYGKSVGYCMKEAIRANMGNTDDNTQYTCMEMTLHGDPSIVLHAQALPDYVITNPDVSFDLQSRPDSFTVFATVKNIAKAINDTIVIEFKRKFPNGDTSSVQVMVPAPYFSSTYGVKFPVDFSRGPGLNKMTVRVDLFNNVQELSENNNSTQEILFLIPGEDITPVYPYKYAVVPSGPVKLKASTGNPFAPVKNYVFQVDTTDLFNSPLMQATTVSSAGGVVEWMPSLLLTDSIVYFWRVSPDSIDTTGYRWKESSFQFIPNRRGWSQDHIFQFKNDKYQFVKHNRQQRSFDFVNDVKNIDVTNFILGPVNGHWADIQYRLNNVTQFYWTCVSWGGGLTFAVFDSVSGEPWNFLAPPSGIGPYGNEACAPGSVFKAYEFYDNTAASQSLVQNFLDTIPDGLRVLVYSQTYHHASQYPQALYEAFDSIGSANIRNIPDTVPFIIWGKKGALPGMATEVIGSSQQSVITLSDTFSSNWNTGHIESEIIGPAVRWNELHWKYHSEEAASVDSIEILVIGIKSNGSMDTLATFTPPTMDVYNLGSYVDSTLYPYIKLVAIQEDDSLRTPPQMDNWMVLYDPAPEAALDPKLGYSFYNDTVQEGESIALSIALQNISEFAFSDSLVFSYWLEDKDHILHTLPDRIKKKNFAPGEILLDTVTVNTEGYAGRNSLWMEVNPLNHPRVQREQYHLNNIAKVDFLVEGDNINPLLDVTFDGVHILNRDIVSSKPNIMVRLKDENKFLALNDSSDFKVFIKSPLQPVAQQVSWGGELSFTPASLPNNSCKLNYTPLFLQDGVYELIVQAKDKSDNQSGAVDYKIEFEVVNKSTITEVLNYPNPFSTSTRFVFTLTGSEVPQNFRIQIMTITGKVVREISQEELGPIHIGRNITEFAWDGTDQYGDQLANGLYLYRVMTQLNGSAIEKRETNADQYFTKGFGKMYLMR